MQFIDYYKVLGVEPSSDAKTIKAAYRKLAHQYHPDVSKEASAEEKFKEIAEAYDVLKNPEKRAEFDQIRQYGQQDGSFKMPPNWHSQSADNGFNFETAGNTSGFSDFFESIFGGANRNRHGSENFTFKQAGQDIELELPVFLEEAISGESKAISYKLPSIDTQGHRVQTTKNLNIKIPKGAISGERVRLKGQGTPGTNGAPNGDLYLILKFAPHPTFDVDGYNLIHSLAIAPWEAALGAKIAVPTLTTPININIPPASQAGQKFRVKGKGLPTKTKDQAGDLFVILQIVMPSEINEESKELWRELAAKNQFDPRGSKK